MTPDLGLAEAHPDAHPRAAAEGDVGALRDALAVARGEALGTEGSGSGQTSGRRWLAHEQ